MTPTILVAGLGRCGTSLVMQMLAAGGVETVGVYPAFEDEREPAFRENVPAWLDLTRGKAVKVLNPHLVRVPYPDHGRAIVLTRNVREQAKSTLKLANLSVPGRANRADRRMLEFRLRVETSEMRRAIERIGTRAVLPLTFEELTKDPRGAAANLAAFAGVGRPDPLSVDAMAACVRPRSPNCLPTLLELELI